MEVVHYRVGLCEGVFLYRYRTLGYSYDVTGVREGVFLQGMHLAGQIRQTQRLTYYVLSDRPGRHTMKHMDRRSDIKKMLDQES